MHLQLSWAVKLTFREVSSPFRSVLKKVNNVGNGYGKLNNIYDSIFNKCMVISYMLLLICLNTDFSNEKSEFRKFWDLDSSIQSYVLKILWRFSEIYNPWHRPQDIRGIQEILPASSAVVLLLLLMLLLVLEDCVRHYLCTNSQSHALPTAPSFPNFHWGRESSWCHFNSEFEDLRTSRAERRKLMLSSNSQAKKNNTPFPSLLFLF